MSLKWRLHFEFVTAREAVELLQGVSSPKEGPVEATSWTGVEQMEVDTFSWDLPIKVLPTNPLLASYVSQFPSTSTLAI